MKPAIREGVDREHVGIEFAKLRLKGLQVFGLNQRVGGLARQTQTDAHRGALGQRIANGRDEFAQTIPDVRPTFTCMDVGAVSEVRLGGKPGKVHGIRRVA